MRFTLLLAFLFLLALTDARAQFAARYDITLDGARDVATAARAEAEAHGWNVAIAIVDGSGHLIYFERMPGTQLASIEIAIAKARTAVRFQRSTKALEDGIAGGRMALLSLDAALFEGGLPLRNADEVVGAIGVSGVTPQQDGIIAQAGVDALATP
jgi:glc operon protein GlcG